MPIPNISSFADFARALVETPAALLETRQRRDRRDAMPREGREQILRSSTSPAARALDLPVFLETFHRAPVMMKVSMNSKVIQCQRRWFAPLCKVEAVRRVGDSATTGRRMDARAGSRKRIP